MSSELERSYRRALGWYPRTWREKNADVVAGTLLDVADAEHRTRPRRGELANLAASGISTRLGVMLEPRARNAISTIALATGAAYMLVYFALQFWSTTSAVRHTMASNHATLVWPEINSGLIIVAVWTFAFLLALMRLQRGLKAVIAIAILAAVAFSVINRLSGVSAEWYGLTTTSLVFIALLGILVLIGRPQHGIRLTLYTGGAFAGIAVADLAIRYLFHGYIDEHLFWINVSRILLPALGAAALAAVVNGIIRRTALAQIIVVSMAPWVAAYMVVCISQDLWNSVAQIGIIATCVGFGVALSAAFHRASPVRRQEPNKL